MKIDSYSVKSTSEWTHERVEISNVAVGMVRNVPLPVPPGAGVIVELSGKDDEGIPENAIQRIIDDMRDEKEKLFEQFRSLAISSQGSIPTVGSVEELKETMLEKLLAILTGKKLSVKGHGSGENRPQYGVCIEKPAIQFRPLNMSTGTTLKQTFESTYYESETMSFTSKGIVNTADGQTIEFDVNLNMSREFYSTFRYEEEVVFCDPIMINFNGAAPELTGEKFNFDLDADGVMDSISFAAPGSGFLALDRNGDGKINDGSELFGPNTGDGFDELRVYDEDGNGWIDESDGIFSQLKIWCKDKYGNDTLYTLKEADVGAIYLGNISTNFSVNGLENSQNGQLKSTSIYLKESGGAGTLSHVDLVV